MPAKRSCTNCGGNGKSGGSECEPCYGTGKQLSDKKIATAEPCGSCGGNGVDVGHACAPCEGRGFKLGPSEREKAGWAFSQRRDADADIERSRAGRPDSYATNWG